MRKRTSDRNTTAGLARRLAKRLPEIIIIAILIFSGLSMWLETPNAIYAVDFVNRSLFGYTTGLEYIPLMQKLLFTVPALLLVVLFVEDIIKVSIMNEPPSEGRHKSRGVSDGMEKPECM